MTSCNDDDNIADILLGGSDSTDTNIADGLKEALRVGTDTATSILGLEDGYFRDEAVKILLPDDVENAISSLQSRSITVPNPTPFSNDIVITGQQLFEGVTIPGIIDIPSLADRQDDLILGINRAAEAAANEAGPIFGDAISNITIQDANNILFGGVDTAATNFLRVNTFDDLFTNFEPRIEDALNTIQVGNVSVVDEYESFVNSYNDILNTSIPTGLASSANLSDLANLTPIGAADLSEFSTGEALNGLFLKVSEEEANIRENPLARVTDLLADVFGQLD